MTIVNDDDVRLAYAAQRTSGHSAVDAIRHVFRQGMNRLAIAKAVELVDGLAARDAKKLVTQALFEIQ